MVRSTPFAILLLLPAIASPFVKADEVRYYDDNGVTYRETRRVTQRPLFETKTEERQQTVYREQIKTEERPTYRTTYTPVTEYQWEPYWANRWNPLSQPYLAYRFVPRTRWETHTEEIKVPVVQRQMVPQTQTVQVPVTTQRLVSEEVITRVAVGSSRSSDPFAAGSASVARKEAVGGVSKLDSDPPRQGSTWGPAAEPVRR
jgi:hypothetical protein